MDLLSIIDGGLVMKRYSIRYPYYEVREYDREYEEEADFVAKKDDTEVCN